MDLFNDVYEFIKFLIPGCLFLSIRNWIASAKREEHEQFLIIKCVSWSFIFHLFNIFINGENLFKKNFLNISQCQWKMIVDNSEYIIPIIVAIILGVLAGILQNSVCIQNFLAAVFKKTNDDNEFVWLWKRKKITKNSCVRFSLADSDAIYIGKIKKVFSLYDSPSIMFEYYNEYDKNGDINVEKCYSSKENYLMIVRYSEIKKFEIIPEPAGDAHAYRMGSSVESCAKSQTEKTGATSKKGRKKK